MRVLLAVLALCALGWLGDRLASRPPAWLRADPIVHPFGLGIDAAQDSLAMLAAAGDTLHGESVADRGPITPDEPLAINVAPVEELMRLPRVGPKLAARIVAYRDSVGPLRSAADLEAVKGIGPSLRRALEPLVRFD
jgi:competence ComEA-like helix-hairpin-helix protein